MSLNKDEVQHIARLARIGLTEEETERFQKDLAGVFGLIEELKEAKLEANTTHSEGATVNQTREDVVLQTDTPADMVKNFPVTKDGFNQVRSVF